MTLVRDGVRKELERLGPILFEKLMSERGFCSVSQNQKASIIQSALKETQIISVNESLENLSEPELSEFKVVLPNE